jgi:hypothetical protein
MSEIPNIGANAIPNINNLGGPSIIPTINPPVVQQTPQALIRSLEVPVFRFTDPSIKYPTLRVPTQEEFDEAVRAEKKAQEDEKAEKSRSLPDAPVIPPIPQVLVPTPPPDEVKNVETPPVEFAKPDTGIPIIEVPLLGPVPVPPKEQVILAGTTATASVAAALIGKSVVEWMVGKMKPIIQQVFVRAKQLMNRDLTPYETQMMFALELDKKTLKLLKKEQKAEKLRQKKVFVESQQHPHISLRKEKQD